NQEPESVRLVRGVFVLRMTVFVARHVSSGAGSMMDRGRSIARQDTHPGALVKAPARALPRPDGSDSRSRPPRNGGLPFGSPVPDTHP
ncbi:MAG TPA: hypothetical protein VE913_15135, partial [Longimicrobium sp.]|nr:hypothetical protein [Longimicrobium sp.]